MPMNKIQYLQDEGKRCVIALLIIVTTQCLAASPQSDLGSPSQKVRDAAAKVLRETYVPPSRTNWDSLIAELKPGTPETNVMKLLTPYTNNIEGTGSSGVVECHRYRLDDLWLLECCFEGESSNQVLIQPELTKEMRRFWVSPPAGFTGAWTNYFVNGQPSGGGYYRDGKLEGEGIGFYPDGSKAMVHSWINGVSEGKETAYYPSGKIKYVGQYHTNAQVGVWTWYKEDGSIESKQDFSNQ